MGENACEKHVRFYSVRSLETLSSSQQKKPFISNCRVDPDYLKAIDWEWHSWDVADELWMVTVFMFASTVLQLCTRGREGRPCIGAFL